MSLSKKLGISVLMIVLAFSIIACSIPEVKYDVTFNSDNDVDSITQEVNDGGKAIAPTVPTKEGFDFLGWFNGSEKFVFESTIVSSNLTLTAKWEAEALPTIPANIDGKYEGSYVALAMDITFNFQLMVREDKSFVYARLDGDSMTTVLEGTYSYSEGTAIFTGDSVVEATAEEKAGIIKLTSGTIPTGGATVSSIVFTRVGDADKAPVIPETPEDVTGELTVSYTNTLDKEVVNSIEYNAITLEIGETINLEYAITRALATESKDVTFSTLFSDIATVDANGVVKGMKAGITVIKVATNATKETSINSPSGTGSMMVKGSAIAEIIVFVGSEDESAKTTYFAGLSAEETEVSYFANFSWMGFTAKLAGEPTDTNTSWTEENLVQMNATLKFSINKDGTFIERLGADIPRATWVRNVDSSLPESTVEEAYTKYGNADDYPGSMFANKGSFYMYDGKIYLVYAHGNAKTTISERVKCLGDATSDVIVGYKPFEFMTMLYENLYYDLSKTDTTSIAGDYDATKTVTMGGGGMSTTLKFKLKLDANGNYIYLNTSDAEANFNISSGTYIVKDDKLTFYYYSMGERKSFEVTLASNTMTSFGKIPTGGMDTELTFNKVIID